MKVAEKIAGVQASIVLFLIYIIIITPLGFVLQKFNPSVLQGKRVTGRKNSFWLKREVTKVTLSTASRQ